MEYLAVILAAALLILAVYLLGRARMILSEVQKMRDDISQLKNIGDLLSVTETTLEEADKSIATAKRVMDSRIKKMEELLVRMDETLAEVEAKGFGGNSRSTPKVKEPATKPVSQESSVDMDKQEREIIARRNRQIILMLEDNIPIEEIARRTKASLREIRLIQKFIK